MSQLAIKRLRGMKAAIDKVLAEPSLLDAIGHATETLCGALKQGHTVISCGNGGSMCDAMHFAQELAGRFRLKRPALAAVAISDPSYLTCVGNDYGFDHVFARYVEGHAVAGDCLLAISTSGVSRNVLLAAEAAAGKGATVIALTGALDSELSRRADIEICTAVQGDAARVQELHIQVIHILVEEVENQLFPQSAPLVLSD